LADQWTVYHISGHPSAAGFAQDRESPASLILQKITCPRPLPSGEEYAVPASTSRPHPSLMDPPMRPPEFPPALGHCTGDVRECRCPMSFLSVLLCAMSYCTCLLQNIQESALMLISCFSIHLCLVLAVDRQSTPLTLLLLLFYYYRHLLKKFVDAKSLSSVRLEPFTLRLVYSTLSTKPHGQLINYLM